MSQVSVDGGQGFRNGFLQSQLQPLFASKTLGSLLKNIDNTTQHLERLGMAHSAVNLDLLSETFDGPLDLKATLHLTEAKKHWWRVQRLHRDTASGTNVGVAINNVFGGAESLALSASFSNAVDVNRDTSYAADFVAPLTLLGSKTDVALSGYATSEEHPWAAHSLLVRGVSARLIGGTGIFRTEVGIDAANRQVINVGNAAGDAVRAAAGDSQKVALITRLSLSKTNDSLYPTSGFNGDVYGEWAGNQLLGLPGVSHFKGVIKANVAKSLDPINNSLTFNFSGATGVLWGQNKSIIDRFFLGGPTDVYGFQRNGLGPKEDGHSVGGEAYAWGNVSLYAKLPKLLRTPSPLRAVFFFNAATLKLHDPNSSFARNDLSVFASPSTSAGLGLTYRTDAVQMELIYSLPLHYKDEDLTHKGVQLGVSLSYF